jgi:hypothetical protein
VLGYFTLDLYLVNRVPTISTWIPVVLLEGLDVASSVPHSCYENVRARLRMPGERPLFPCIFHVWRLEWPGLAEISTIR